MLPLQEYAKETKRGAKSDLANNIGDKNKTKGGLIKTMLFNGAMALAKRSH